MLTNEASSIPAVGDEGKRNGVVFFPLVAVGGAFSLEGTQNLDEHMEQERMDFSYDGVEDPCPTRAAPAALLAWPCLAMVGT